MKSPSDDEKDFRARIFEDIRPWGKFRVFPHENAGSLKIITVNPGASLSLQYHRKRAEFWIALDEGLEITVGERTWRPRRNEEIYIPREAAHRLRCAGPEPARVMEIWLGDSAEDDIVRLADDYGR
jgi:mannose-6-phosphate isomerase-like protein (cupin superfamily)